MNTRTLFSAQVANGDSAASRVTPQTGSSNGELILLRGYGTWSGVTVKVQLSDNANASPSTWTDAVNETGGVIGSFSADFAVNLNLPSGIWFRVNLSGAGSPVPSLTVRATGDIEAG